MSAISSASDVAVLPVEPCIVGGSVKRDERRVTLF
jgi:hypothetical protein